MLPHDAAAVAGKLAMRPLGSEINGYVNRVFIAHEAAGDKLSVCERLQRQGSKAVGRAHLFVCWWFGAQIAVLVDALERYLRECCLARESTFFWIADISARQDCTPKLVTQLPQV